MASGSSGKGGGRSGGGSRIKNTTRAQQRANQIFSAAASAGAPF